MKARLVKDTVCPMCGSATSKQTISNNLEATKLIWELTLMVTLRNVYGFGNKRMMKFFDDFHETQKWFENKSKLTDTKRDEYSDIDTTIITISHLKEKWHILNADNPKPAPQSAAPTTRLSNPHWLSAPTAATGTSTTPFAVNADITADARPS